MRIFIFTLFCILISCPAFSASDDSYRLAFAKVYLARGLTQEAEAEAGHILAAKLLDPEGEEDPDEAEGQDIPLNSEDTSRIFDRVGILAGFLDERVTYDEDYKGIPFLFTLGFDGRPLLSKIGLDTAGRFDLIIEPFINAMFEAKANVEIGSNFLFEYAFPLTERFQPYLKGGLGVVYMTQHIEDQATQYNFLPQGALGFHYYIDDNISFDCEYRHRHLSNASIKRPNKGVDAKLYTVGFSFFFD